MHDAAAVLVFVTSGVLSVVFLVTLMTCALIKHLWTRSTPSSLEAAREARAKPIKPQRHQDLKLKMDLAYYVNAAGLEFRRYTVTTLDGHRLALDRVGNGGDTSAHPVLLMHGLMQSSAAYCTSGDESLAFKLARDGFDVWLGNNRGGFHPSHVKYHTRLNRGMWNWGIRDMASSDLTSIVDYVLNITKKRKLALVAHSQGTTAAFMALARDVASSNDRAGSASSVSSGSSSTDDRLGGDLYAKLSSFSALSPAIYAGPLITSRWYLRLVQHLGRTSYRVCFGDHAFLGIMNIAHGLMPEVVYGFFGYIMFNYLLGWTDSLWDPKFRARQFVFSPVYVSAQLMFWWLASETGFASTGCALREDQASWFPDETPPIQIFAPGRDNLVLAEPLISRMANYEKSVKVQVVDLPSYSHLDPLWAADASETVGVPLSTFIREHELSDNK